MIMTWEARLLRARKNHTFTVVDKRLVKEWSSCAVGERFHIDKKKLQRVGSEVYALGGEFMFTVNSDDVQSAQLLYDRLQTTKRYATREGAWYNRVSPILLNHG